MKRQRVIRASSAQSLCIFCATRLSGEGPVLSSQRRYLNTTKGTYQSAAAAVAYRSDEREHNGSRIPPPPASGNGWGMGTSRKLSPREIQARQAMEARLEAQKEAYRRAEHQERERQTTARARAQHNARPTWSTRQQIQSTPGRYSNNVAPARDHGFERFRRDGTGSRSIIRKMESEHRIGVRRTSAPLELANMVCHRCGEKGHKAIDCPSENLQATMPRPHRAAAHAICFYCGGKGHFASACPNKNPAPKAVEASSSGVDLSTEYPEVAAARRLETETAGASSARVEDAAETRRRRDREMEEERETRDRERRARRGRRSEMEEETEDGALARSERKRQRKAVREAAKRREEAEVKAAAPKPIYLPEYISVINLANMLRVNVEEFIVKMEELGYEDVQNDHLLNAENAGLIAMEYNFEPIVETVDEGLELRAALESEDKSSLPARPPVVTIMGHVDHGKTTILDFLRNSSVAATEFGGITQHIGAFSVPLSGGKMITFLDTPGHAAFLTMRQRGANVTDIVVLVVAADDSVKPQTIEAIKHAQAAGVPMIVAINKMDKPEANPEKVKQDLGGNGVEIEDFGGDTQVVCVSGKTGLGMKDLEENIITLSEILDHRADPTATVEGWILEATTKKAGKVATVLVKQGTLKLGDIVVAGSTWARVRSLKNEAGVAVKEVFPGVPVEVDGWKGQPEAGDEVLQARDEGHATSVVEYRKEKGERTKMVEDMEAINEARRLEQERKDREKAIAAGEVVNEPEVESESGPKIVKFIVKADVFGSTEAVEGAIAAIGNGDVQCSVLRSGVGAVSEFDIEHAAAAGGHILSFNVPTPNKLRTMAEKKGVTIMDENIIYRVVESVKDVLSEHLPPVITQRVQGEAEIGAVFSITLGGKEKLQVAGCKVRNGRVMRNSMARVLRNGELVHDGVISTLKSHKKDVPEMGKGTECGISFESWEAFEVGDQIQVYEEKSEKRKL